MQDKYEHRHQFGTGGLVQKDAGKARRTGRQPGPVFQGAINKVSKAAILYRIVQMIGWGKCASMSSDVKDEIYEGLLQKNEEGTKSSAGQYFTPCALI